MKKIILALALLTLAACQTPQQRRAEAINCVICMLKAQVAEANVRACPSHVRLNSEKEFAYKTFKAMSEVTFKEAHTGSVNTSVARIKREKTCTQAVERIKSGNMMYEFMAVKS